MRDLRYHSINYLVLRTVQEAEVAQEEEEPVQEEPVNEVRSETFVLSSSMAHAVF